MCALYSAVCTLRGKREYLPARVARACREHGKDKNKIFWTRSAVRRNLLAGPEERSACRLPSYLELRGVCRPQRLITRFHANWCALFSAAGYKYTYIFVRCRDTRGVPVATHANAFPPPIRLRISTKGARRYHYFFQIDYYFYSL